MMLEFLALVSVSCGDLDLAAYFLVTRYADTGSMLSWSTPSLTPRQQNSHAPCLLTTKTLQLSSVLQVWDVSSQGDDKTLRLSDVWQLWSVSSSIVVMLSTCFVHFLAVTDRPVRKPQEIDGARRTANSLVGKLQTRCGRGGNRSSGGALEPLLGWASYACRNRVLGGHFSLLGHPCCPECLRLLWSNLREGGQHAQVYGRAGLVTARLQVLS